MIRTFFRGITSESRKGNKMIKKKIAAVVGSLVLMLSLGLAVAPSASAATGYGSCVGGGHTWSVRATWTGSGSSERITQYSEYAAPGGNPFTAYGRGNFTAITTSGGVSGTLQVNGTANVSVGPAAFRQVKVDMHQFIGPLANYVCTAYITI